MVRRQLVSGNRNNRNIQSKLMNRTDVNYNLNAVRPTELLQERVTKKSLKSFFVEKKAIR